MKITKLVILFNYQKILLGFVVSTILLALSFFIESNIWVFLFRIFGVLIVLNVAASLLASYILYDNSDLYELKNLKGIVNWNDLERAVLVHASFDPLSKSLEEKYPNLKLTVCDILKIVTNKKGELKLPRKYFRPTLKK